MRWSEANDALLGSLQIKRAICRLPRPNHLARPCVGSVWLSVIDPSRRERLVKRAREQGFEVLVEHCAYTRFNRLCAIRYMELHGYLDHGFRMLSGDPAAFECWISAVEVAEALSPENKAQLVEMKFQVIRMEALYRGNCCCQQCHALHHAMPFLFGSR